MSLLTEFWDHKWPVQLFMWALRLQTLVATCAEPELCTDPSPKHHGFFLETFAYCMCVVWWVPIFSCQGMQVEVRRGHSGVDSACSLGPGDGTQVVRLGSKCLYSLKLLYHPQFLSFLLISLIFFVISPFLFSL